MKIQDLTSEDVKLFDDKLIDGIRTTFRGMMDIFKVMREYKIDPIEMTECIATIVGESYDGSTIDMYVYDCIVNAILVVYAPILTQ